MPPHALLVLGMHRSGTSALAGALHHAGATAGDGLMGESRNNQKGYYESATVLGVMEDLLQACDSFWHDWRALDLLAAPRDETRALRRRLARHLKDQFTGQPVFTMKDPRFCRALGFLSPLLSAFGATRTTVIMVRRPGEVVASLAARNGMTPDKALLLWLRHVLDAERMTRGEPRLFVTYDGLLANLPGLIETIAANSPAAAAARLRAGVAQGAAFIEPTLRHNALADEPEDPFAAIAPWFGQTWAVMQDYAARGVASGREAELDAIQAAFDRWSAPFATQFAASEWMIGALRQQIGQMKTQVDGALAIRPDSAPSADALLTRGRARKTRESPESE